MRITYVAPRVWPAVGGMENFLRHLTHSLSSTHDVTVLAQGTDGGARSQLADSLRPPPTFEPFDDEHVHVAPLRLSAARRAALAPLVHQVVPGLRRYAYTRPRIAAARLYARVVGPVIAQQASGADILHVWGSDLLGAATVHAGQLLDVPVLTTPFAHEGQWADNEPFAVTYRRADRVVALLETEARLYERLGVAPARISVCGVCTPGVARGLGEALRRRLGIDGPLVVFLGVRRPYKGYGLLRDAARLVPGAQFAFVGPGPRVEGPGVIDAGEVDDEERGAWLDAADLLCLPSDAEILPSSILEAWSVGTPALTSDIPALVELVEHTGGGFTVARDVNALAARLRELLADPDRLRAAGEAGRRAWQERYTPAAVAAHYERLYLELVRPARAAA